MPRGFIFFPENMAILHFNYSGLLSFATVKDKLIHFSKMLSKPVFTHATIDMHDAGPLLILMKYCNSNNLACTCLVIYMRSLLTIH